MRNLDAFETFERVRFSPPPDQSLTEEGHTLLHNATDNVKRLPEAISIKFQVGTFSTTIPAGSFQQNKHGNFVFEDVIDGVFLDVVIVPLGNSNFAFKAEGVGADLTGTVNPVTVGLTIGNNAGTTTVTTELE